MSERCINTKFIRWNYHPTAFPSTLEENVVYKRSCFPPCAAHKVAEIDSSIINFRCLSLQPASTRRLPGIDSECSELHHHARSGWTDTGLGAVSRSPAQHHYPHARLLQFDCHAHAVTVDNREARWVREIFAEI